MRGVRQGDVVEDRLQRLHHLLERQLALPQHFHVRLGQNLAVGQILVEVLMRELELFAARLHYLHENDIDATLNRRNNFHQAPRPAEHVLGQHQHEVVAAAHLPLQPLQIAQILAVQECRHVEQLPQATRIFTAFHGLLDLCAHQGRLGARLHLEMRKEDEVRLPAARPHALSRDVHARVQLRLEPLHARQRERLLLVLPEDGRGVIAAAQHLDQVRLEDVNVLRPERELIQIEDTKALEGLLHVL
mmetsp:Transcript_98735/g.255260  ORF Transcript_98735/g.255260 Transcript_98735/m.255260 type:complete len:246 (+) Transcript_98735:595-1332(+)